MILIWKMKEDFIKEIERVKKLKILELIRPIIH